MKTRKTVALARKAFALLAALCMACMLSVGAFAETATNEAVRNDTTGVVQLKMIYTDPNGTVSDIQDGTGFLINDSTVITCNHVVQLDRETMAMAAEAFGCSVSDVQNRLSIQVSVLRDVTINATIKNSSAEMDFAILDLQSQLYDRTYLPIRSSSTLKQTEAAYTLGFPGEVQFFQDVNTYTSDDVTITAGQINKLSTIGGVDFVQTSARITSGNSGCPLVDSNGAVIGICQGATGSDFDSNYFYAIAIDQLTKTLDSLGISYTKYEDSAPVATPAAQGSTATEAPAPAPAPSVAPAGDSATEPVAEAQADKSTLTALIEEMQSTVEAKNYSEDTSAAFSAALEKAQTVADNTASTQADVDGAVSELNAAFEALKPANNLKKFLPFIAAGIVALVLIIVVIIVFMGKKKKPEVYDGYDNQPGPDMLASGVSGGFAPVTPTAPAPAPAPAPYMPPMNMGSGETSVLNAGAGETSVLNAGAGETTLLGGSQSFGTLTRSKNGERITLNNANFIIGKERAKVNYCVSDNTSVSRAHVTLRSHGGKTYLVDMKATNGTFVNGIRMNPGQETPLNNGDKILLADEEFIYRA